MKQSISDSHNTQTAAQLHPFTRHRDEATTKSHSKRKLPCKQKASQTGVKSRPPLPSNTAVAQAAGTGLGNVGKIDKLILVLPLHATTEDEMLGATDRLQASDLVTRKTAKGEAYRLIQAMRCDNGTKVVFETQPNKPGMRFSLKITMNPDHIDRDAAHRFLDALKLLFPLTWKVMLGSMLIFRVDQAYDHPVSVANLLIQLQDSRVEQKFFVATNNSLEVQTWYAGNLSSKLHWIIYDQVASDMYKAQHGEHLGRRVEPRADAEFVVDSGKKGGHTRFEARRMFQDPKPLREVNALGKPFPVVDVYLVDDEKIQAGPQGFCIYLDSVRLRGIAGARKHFLRYDKNAGAKHRLLSLEQHLTACAAPFWPKSSLNSSVEDALSQLVVWNVLKHMAS